MPSNRPWFAIHERKPYTGNYPPFEDMGRYAWTSHLESNFEVIREEINRVLSVNQQILQPHFHNMTSGRGEDWKTIPLITWGITWMDILQQFPQARRILEQVPGIVSASINKLEAGSALPPHLGETNATIRCHLGITIPAGLPDCGLKVNSQEVAWEEGKLTGFCDAYTHEAWNHSGADRYILLLDVIRPEFLSQMNHITSTCIATYIMLFLDDRLKVFQYPSYLQKGIFAIIYLATAAFMAIERRLHIAGKIRKR